MKESLIYPGEYIPLPEMEFQSHCQMSWMSGSQAKPLVNMNETGDTIMIEVALPGVNRDQLSISTRYNILSILILGNVASTGKQKQDTVHEFDHGYSERHIVLPEHADTDFMSAEFKQGVLHLYIPKTGADFATSERQVIVY